VEIAYHISDQDLVLRVNKGDCQIFRVRLADALTLFPEYERTDFRVTGPDFVFQVGNPNERFLTMARCLGLDAEELIRLEEHLEALGPES
jgi:hypothetical protein